MKKLFILFLAVLFLAACGSDEEGTEAVTEEEPEQEIKEEIEEEIEEEVEEEVEEETQEEEKTTEETTEEAATEEESEEPVEEETSWDDVKNMNNIVGNSDKDFTELTDSSPSEVRNDNTGNWRYITISENVDMEEYALSYEELHMNEDEVHFIINFNYNTTTMLNNLDGLLYLDVYEYEDGEEHDASTLASGVFLKSYAVYPDGDIEEVE